MTTLINGVNAIYERDLGIHLTLVANETSIIFTNPVTDGYTSNDVTQMLTQNQSILISALVLLTTTSVWLWMVVSLVRCQASSSREQLIIKVYVSMVEKGRPSRYCVPLSHQRYRPPGLLLMSSATCSGRYTRSTVRSTIVARADLLRLHMNQEVARQSWATAAVFCPTGVISRFVLATTCCRRTLTSILSALNRSSISLPLATAATCPVLTDTGNTPPSVDAGPDYTIPANTPFALTATGSDLDADALTYCWEEFDLGAAGPPHTDNGNRPIFRSFAPVPYPTRMFPQLSDILRRVSTFGESLPTTNRTMNFRVTVRDNHAGGGGVNTGAMHVNVVSNSGPFVVTDPFSPKPGMQVLITQSRGMLRTPRMLQLVATNVRILLSIDGGLSFPFTLASSMPNSGSATISVPNVPTLFARVKVEAIDNIFFSISQEFRITPSSTGAPICSPKRILIGR